MDSCKGRVAIVTGGGNGMGRAAAHLLAKEGAKVVVNDVAASKEQPGKMCADIVAEEIRAMGFEAVASNDDLADPATGEKLVKLAVDTFGTVDILCMVAGATTGPMPIEDMSVELFQKICNINTTSMFALMHHAVPIMKEKGYEFFMDSNTNQQFIIVEDAKLQEIRQKYGVTYQERYDETHSVIRLCTSWATKEENVKAFLQDM